MTFMFEKLEVYQKAVSFADEIAKLTEQFPRGYYFLTDQLNTNDSILGRKCAVKHYRSSAIEYLLGII
jgi:hypothetical protein